VPIQDSAHVVIIKPGSNGNVSIWVQTAARVIVDLQGYYEQSPTITRNLGPDVASVI
jgi:hypothetical protein